MKADQLDDSSVWQEWDEFVITRELDQHFRKFISWYLEAVDQEKNPDPTGKMGIWISGFFGSGKSHFLKVLSYLLRNHTHTNNGQSRQAIEFFESKVKDAMLFGDIKRAVAANTDVILFNIDSKADHRTGRDLILRVFLKVLNELQGYSVLLSLHCAKQTTAFDQPVRGRSSPRIDCGSKGTSYDRLSSEAAAILKIEDHLPNQEIDQLFDVMTFLAVEKRIASSLRERVRTTANMINADDVRAIATRRQSGHWASRTVADSTDAPRHALHAVYDALLGAADFFALRNLHKSGFDYPDAASMYRAYETELYRFDSYIAISANRQIRPRPLVGAF